MKSVYRIPLLAALIVVALIAPGAAAAQQPPPPECGEMLSDSLAAIQDTLTEAEAFAADDDVEGALLAFNEAASLVDEIRAACGPGGPTSAEPAMPRLPVDVLCGDYPQYCVPMAGGSPIDGWPNESPELRPTIDETAGVTDVVRGLTADGAPFIGDPDSPIHFLEYFDFACIHCVNYEEEAVAPLIEGAVLSGQATYEMRPMAFVAGNLSLYAAHAMLCAGEQGALWEMADALYDQYRVDQAQAYTLDSIRTIANQLGLDGDDVVECTTSNRYSEYMAGFSVSFYDLGLNATPSMLVRYGPDEEWVKLDDRSLENVLALIEEAQP